MMRETRVLPCAFSASQRHVFLWIKARAANVCVAHSQPTGAMNVAHVSDTCLTAFHTCSKCARCCTKSCCDVSMGAIATPRRPALQTGKRLQSTTFMLHTTPGSETTVSPYVEPALPPRRKF